MNTMTSEPSPEEHQRLRNEDDHPIGMSPDGNLLLKGEPYTLTILGSTDEVAALLREVDEEDWDLSDLDSFDQYLASFTRDSERALLFDENGNQHRVVRIEGGLAGYAWARYGYAPTPASWQGLRAELQLRMQARDDIAAEDRTFVIDNLAQGPKAIWAIAEHRLGRALLEGTTWVAVFDSDDPEARMRFDAVTGNARFALRRMEFEEEQHPRGQPLNRGQFRSKGGAEEQEGGGAEPAASRQQQSRISTAPDKPKGKIEVLVPKDVPFAEVPLNEQEKVVEARARTLVAEHGQELFNEYLMLHGKVASTDEARQMFTRVGYNGLNSMAVHESASLIAKAAWKYGLLNNDGEYAIITAGGMGAGKTTATKSLFKNEIERAAVVLDSTLSSVKSAGGRIKDAVEAGKTPWVIFIWRDPAEAWENGVVKRMLSGSEVVGRVARLVDYVKILQASLNTNQTLARNQMDKEENLGDSVKMTLIDNTRGMGNAVEMTPEDFVKLAVPTNLHEKLAARTKELYDKGELGITKEQYVEMMRGSEHLVAEGDFEDEEEETEEQKRARNPEMKIRLAAADARARRKKRKRKQWPTRPMKEEY